MAERRMFAKTIIDSDAFIEMPTSTRLLYFDLGMRADDDGFINSPKKIIKMTGASEDDLKILITKNFVIPFETGVVVIKHWRINNYIQKDRYKPTVYREEMAKLKAKDNNVYSLDTQYRLGKDRLELGKDSIEESDGNPVPASEPTDTTEKIHFGDFVTMTNAEYEKLVSTYGKEFADQCIEKLDNYKGSSGKNYKSDYRAILSWVVDQVKGKKGTNKPSNAYVNSQQKEFENLDGFYAN